MSGTPCEVRQSKAKQSKVGFPKSESKAKQSKVRFPKSESKAKWYWLVVKKQSKVKQSKAKQSSKPATYVLSPTVFEGQSDY